MKEQKTRYFYPETDDEEIYIIDLRRTVAAMDGCTCAFVMGEGDHHYIEATFKIPFE